MNLIRIFPIKCAFLTHRHQCIFLHSSTLWRKLVQFNLSDIGEGIAEVQVKEWHVKEGDFVNEFDELCLVQSDKASVTISSRYNGTIKKLYYKSDEIAQVGKPLVDIELPESGDEPSPSSPQFEQKAPLPPTSAAMAQDRPTPRILASPAVRRLIRGYGLIAADIRGSGKEGRVLKEDVLNLVGNRQPASHKTHLPNFTQAAMVDTDTGPKSSSDDEQPTLVPIRGYARAMVKTMTDALKIPHFGYSDEVVMDQLIETKKILQPIAERRRIKLSFMPLIIKATSLTLLEYPSLNASFDQKMENLVYKNSHNISLAVDTKEGLAVPNIKNCQRKSILQIASDLDGLLQRGRKGHFNKEDLTDGTFTLSNIGSIGGTYMSPVILPPQVVIGALGRIQKVARFDEFGELVQKHIINFSWSADHRAIDGATMARFSNHLKQYLECPELMLAELR